MRLTGMSFKGIVQTVVRIVTPGILLGNERPTRPNPRRTPKRSAAKRRTPSTRRNPATVTKAELERARSQSRTFHGSGAGAVIVLSAAERNAAKPPRVVVPIGVQEAVTYRTHDGSKRGGDPAWEHQAGDRGAGRPQANGRKLLVADPRTGKTYTLPGRSKERFNANQGLVG